jgi:hypothetical protein
MRIEWTHEGTGSRASCHLGLRGGSDLQTERETGIQRSGTRCEAWGVGGVGAGALMQPDGNWGLLAAVVEALMQSRDRQGREGERLLEVPLESPGMMRADIILHPLHTV